METGTQQTPAQVFTLRAVQAVLDAAKAAGDDAQAALDTLAAAVAAMQAEVAHEGRLAPYQAVITEVISAE